MNAAAQSIHDALVRRLGAPNGSGGRSVEAYRTAAKRLGDAGVLPESLDRLLADYGAAVLMALGPMPLASHLAGTLNPKDVRRAVVARWPKECALCQAEIPRGALAWWRRRPDGTGFLVCTTCEPGLSLTGELAAEARRWALQRDDDAESLLAAILAQTPPDVRAEVEDSLPVDALMESP